jgi:hypothetical protein
MVSGGYQNTESKVEEIDKTANFLSTIGTKS